MILRRFRRTASDRGRAHLRLLALATLVAALAGTVVAGSGAGLGLERAIQSVRDGLRQRPASGSYALVELDARSLASLDHWPWPRGLYAQALERLQRAGASTIAFDVDFSSRSAPDQDAAFARAIDHARVPVVLSTFRQSGSLADGGVVENLPIASLRRNAQLAAVNIAADGDGIVRDYPFGVTTAGVPRPSIGATLAGASGAAGDSFAIDGSIDPASIPRVSFVDLIRGRVPAGALAGRPVLIGATAIELGDRYAVPRYGVIPGPVIQLLAAETLHDRSSPVDRGPVLPLLLALAALWLGARARGRAFAATIAAGLASLCLLPLALEAGRLGTVEIVPGLAALVAGAVVIVVANVLGTLRTARLVDPVSGLPNRRGFETDTRGAAMSAVTVARIANYSDAAALVGQERAAALIGRVIDRLQVAVVGPLYRLEEGVLAWTVADDAGADATDQLDGLAALMRAPFEVGGRRLELRCHFGAAVERGATATATALADRAILAADHAIEQGTRWELHSAALDASQDWRLTLAGELDEALGRGDIWVAYQPKLDIASGRVTGAEALVRWRHPERGAIPPDAFIPALEASGHILDLTLFVLREATAAAARWHASSAAINVAVNVSALLATNETFLDEVDALIERGAITPALLTLEVTESATLADPERAVAALERIAARGIKISIDDYGTGQSTLTYLKRLPAREIKIDKSFVLGLETSRGDQAMVRSTVSLAHELGFAVVAEGVETAGVLALLREMGCDTGQGWHIGKPMAEADFSAVFVMPPAIAA